MKDDCLITRRTKLHVVLRYTVRLVPQYLVGWIDYCQNAIVGDNKHQLQGKRRPRGRKDYIWWRLGATRYIRACKPHWKVE